MIILVGISGSGKSTIAKYLEEKGYSKLVTTTTRPKRCGEIEGKDYFFTDKETFEKNLKKYKFVTNYAGNYYGIDNKELEDCSRKYVILDTKGAMEMKKELKENAHIIYVYITIEEMVGRLNARGETPEEIKKRFKMAISSEAFFNMYDHIIINMDKNYKEKIDEILKEIEAQ